MQQFHKFNAHQIDALGMPLWVFALGFSGGYFRYDVRVLDVDETGQVVGLARLLEYPILTDRNLSAFEASEQILTIRETIEAYGRIAASELGRLEKGIGAPASGPGSIPADASTEPH